VLYSLKRAVEVTYVDKIRIYPVELGGDVASSVAMGFPIAEELLKV
jgi:hypothetical protein